MEVYRVTENTIMLQLGDKITNKTHQHLLIIKDQLVKDKVPGIIECVIGFTTLTVYFDFYILSHHDVTSYIKQLAHTKKPKEVKGKLHQVPVCYEGENAPDIAYVARKNNLTVDEVIKLHTQSPYTVYFLGFSPGFPFLGGLDERIATPRKEKPRLQVPRGSVGIAGSQTGIYPSISPGGWQLIGRSPIHLLHLYKKQPTLLKAGDQITFYPISKETFDQYHRKEGFK